MNDARVYFNLGMSNADPGYHYTYYVSSSDRWIATGGLTGFETLGSSKIQSNPSTGSVNMALRHYNCTHQTVFIDSGLQLEIMAMRTLPDNGLILQLPKRKSGFALAHWQDGRPCRINSVR
ncbi:hypothetical protein BGW80DRAFT_1256480 [Lactifluus volemus]|nr:hypothetical protein BGW80DRAFT_1256480 [Lactifluus volemus]